MTDYLLLLKISPGKIIDVLNSLRSFPNSPSSGIDLNYTMNIFGTWDVGIWFKANNATQAIDFVNKKVKGISGVVDSYTVPTFPHVGGTHKWQAEQATAEKSEKNE